MSADFTFLASASPRRQALLAQIGVHFKLLHVSVDEAVEPGEMAEVYVTRVATAKAVGGWKASRGPAPPPPAPAAAPVLAADTAVVVDGRILGKPAGRQDGERMLRELSGRTHQVLTAVALATAGGLQSRLSRSEVTFRTITDAEAKDYWDTGEPHDKAGGYAIQGRAAIFIAELRGSYSGVMGLPLYETAELLRSAGVPSWR
ncbi:MAG: Maf family nucleotide pyrophosphatase [Pseudomonadota bacterium]|nr:Maf family nucleotide pyrophosphatase [Pseudomonadota bacterium]